MKPSGKPSHSMLPSAEPSLSDQPSEVPSFSVVPSESPTTSANPSSEPSISSFPSAQPSTSQQPSIKPSESVAPSEAPTTSIFPSEEPTLSQKPSGEPSMSLVPSIVPSASSMPSFSEVVGTAFFAKNKTPGFKDFSFLDEFHIGGDAIDVGAQKWFWMRGAEAPNREEKIIVGITQDGDITGELFNGTAWRLIDIAGSDPTAHVLASGYTDVCTNQDGVCWPRTAVAYESSSGNAMLLWGDKQNHGNRLRYSVWDGRAWTTADGVPEYTGGEPQWIQMASKPASNEIAVAIADGDDNVNFGGSTVDHVLIWDGNSAEWVSVFEVDSSGASHTEQPSISVAYESQRGRAMVVYGANGDSSIYFRIWNGARWGNEQTLAAPVTVSGHPSWTDLKSDRNSNNLVLGVQTSDHEVWLSIWNGNSWEDTIDTQTSTTPTDLDFESSNMAVEFASNTGDVLAVYGKGSSDGIVRYRSWDALRSSWSDEDATGDIAAGHEARIMTLDADPNPDSERIMLLVVNDKRDLFAAVWQDPTAKWAMDEKLEDHVVDDSMMTQNFLFLWERNASNKVVIAPTISPAPTSSLHPSLTPSSSPKPSRSVSIGGTALWSASNVVHSRYSEFDGLNFDSFNSGPIVDDLRKVLFTTGIFAKAWVSVRGATSPYRDEKIVVGVTDRYDVTGIMWDGSSWSQIVFNGTNVLSSSSVTSADWNNAIVAYESSSGDALLIWNDGKDTKKPRYSLWNGLTWSGPLDFPTYSSSHEPYWFDTVSNPFNNNILLVIVDSEKDLYTATWSGSTWGPIVQVGTIPDSRNDINIDPVTLNSYAGVGVAYEAMRNRAVLVYGEASSGAISYRILTRLRAQNGWTFIWSNAETISVSSFNSTVQRVMLKSDNDPYSNRLVLGFIDEAQSAWVGIWSGTTWQDVILGSADLTGHAYQNMDVAFESQSHKALAVFGDDSTTGLVRSQVWTDGSGWEAVENAGVPSKSNTMTLTSNPNSNQVMLMVQDENKALYPWLWDGETWSSFPVLELDTGVNKYQPFVFLWNDGRSQTRSPSEMPSAYENPTLAPSARPTVAPTPRPTTLQPTPSPPPTDEPTAVPSHGPSLRPSESPSAVPSAKVTTQAPVSISIRITDERDDGEEYRNLPGGGSNRRPGHVELASSDLEFCREDTTGDERHLFVGLRFQSVNVPKGAIIQSASISLSKDYGESGISALDQERGELPASGDAPQFKNCPYDCSGEYKDSECDEDNPVACFDISRRANDTAGTPNTVQWIIDQSDRWDSEGIVKTPDIRSIIQDIVDMDEWRSNNALVINFFGSDTLDGEGSRIALASDSCSKSNFDCAPVLHIEYNPSFLPPTLVPSHRPSSNSGKRKTAKTRYR